VDDAWRTTLTGKRTRADLIAVAFIVVSFGLLGLAVIGFSKL
jgi:hypothetical protein